uniref:Formamidopyrimidine-DNA glycosylase catalytic domain-containing protein n=1 Tax=Tetradesmus obliquus TaxID=3088 RepID=A0A383VM22_TETOB|eukprot:jgi/Sobl393_1/15449/SZX65869.1
MPELPEVEAARRILEEHCVGREITLVDAAEDEKIFGGSSPQQLVAALQGRRLLAAGRKGKNLWLSLEGAGPMPLMHFGMTGYIAVRDAAGDVHIVAYENAPQGAGSWPPRFHKLLLHFGPHPDRPDGPASCELAYCDARRFGKVRLVDGDPAACEAITKLGWDPLLALPSLAQFGTALAAKAKGAARLKPLLLDQSFCAGVGNWVADEVLWQARLHPEQLLSELQPQHVEALHAALQHVVQVAVAANADSSKFPEDWMFHIRWGKKAGTLAGHKIDHITVGSRTSCYVPALQKLIGGGAAGKAAKAAKPAASKKRKSKQAEEQDNQQQQQQPPQDENEEAGEQQQLAEAAGSKARKQPVAAAGPAKQTGKRAAPAAAAAAPAARGRGTAKRRASQAEQQKETEDSTGGAAATGAEQQGSAAAEPALATAAAAQGPAKGRRKQPAATSGAAAAGSSRKKRR